MDTSDIPAHALSAITGGGGVALVSKYLLQRWLNKQDKLADAVSSMKEELIKISAKLESFVRWEDRNMEREKTVAVLHERLENVKKDVNNIGCKVRGLQNGEAT